MTGKFRANKEVTELLDGPFIGFAFTKQSGLAQLVDRQLRQQNRYSQIYRERFVVTGLTSSEVKALGDYGRLWGSKVKLLDSRHTTFTLRCAIKQHRKRAALTVRVYVGHTLAECLEAIHNREGLKTFKYTD
jgi:hypothetical protein